LIQTRQISASMALRALEMGMRERFGGYMELSPSVQGPIRETLEGFLSTNRLTEEGMNSLGTAGVNAWGILADKIMTDVPGAMAAVRDGRVTVDQFMGALAKSNTIQGFNWFPGVSEAANRTFKGLLSNLMDYVKMASIKIGAPFFGGTKGVLE